MSNVKNWSFSLMLKLSFATEWKHQLSLLLRELKLIWQMNIKIDMRTRNTFRVCYVKAKIVQNIFVLLGILEK